MVHFEILLIIIITIYNNIINNENIFRNVFNFTSYIENNENIYYY